MNDPYAAFSDPVDGPKPQAAPQPAATPQPRQSAQPRGIRNNNPGNIEDGPFARSLPGYAGSDGRFARFDNPEAGSAAKTRLLGSYVQRGFNTPAAIINRWAPPSDNNPTADYAAYVARRAGIGVNDPVTDQHIPLIAQAINEFENGQTQQVPMADAQQVGQADPYAAFSEPETEVVDAFPQGQGTAPGSSRDAPINLANLRYEDEVQALKQGAWVRNGDEVYQLPGDAFTDKARSSDEPVSGNLYVRRPNLEDEVGAFTMAAAEQVPLLEESAIATAGALTGNGYAATRESYDLNRDLLNQTNRDARNAGGIAGFASTLLLPGAAASGKYVAQGVGRLDQARRAAQVGLGGGALFGAANTDGNLQDRAQAGAVGGLIGAAAGPLVNEIVGAVPGLIRRTGSGASEATSRVTRGIGIQPAEKPVTPQATDAAMDYVKGLLNQSGRDIASDPVAALGKPITAAEAMGRTGINQMTALSRRSGQAGDMALDVLGSRAVEQSGRVLDDLAAASGLQPGAAEDAISTIARQSREAARPLYETAYQAQNVDSPALRDLMSRPSVRAAMNKAVKIAQDEGRNPDELGMVTRAVGVDDAGLPILEVTEVRAPSMQTWDYVKRGMDDVLEGYRDSTTGRMNLDTGGRAAEANRQALRAELANTSQPWGAAYKAALEAGGDAPRVEAAFREGPNLFSSRVNERTFRQRVEGMNETQRNATLAGIVDDLFNKARTGRVNIRQLRTPAVREKMALLMGPEKADGFLTRLAAEADMARSGARMAPGTNSTTAEALEAMREQDRGVGWISDFADKMDNGKGPIGAAIETGTEALLSPVAGFVRGFQAPASQPVRDEIARLLLMDPNNLAGLLASRAGPRRPVTPAAAAGGLLSVPVAQSGGLLSQR